MLSGSFTKVGNNEIIENIRKEEKDEAVHEEDQEGGRLNRGKIKIGTEPLPVPMDPKVNLRRR